MINISGLNFKYNSYKETKVLNNISFDVRKGEIVCLLGPSGCGKTSILRLIAGLETPNSGSITIAGVCVTDDHVFVDPHKRAIGFLFQDFALFPHLTVEENIAWGLIDLNQKNKMETITELLQQTSMRAHKDKYPHELSGGEQQRVSLARALAPKPSLLLLDEPFSSLDSNLRNDIRKETIEILKNTNTTAIIVTHDPEEAMLIAERIILMSDGKIQQDGTAENLYNNPEGRFAASFFGYVNNLSGLVKGKIIETDLGNIPNQNFKDGDNLHIIIRPQALSVSIQENPNQHEHCATIKSIRFVGTSYHIWSELYIWDGTHKQLLSIQTETGNLKKGDKIEYHVDNEKIFLYRK